MAIRPFNSIAGFSTGDPAVTIIQANGDVSTINFTANGVSNLGPVGNLILTGGSDGQFIKTNGSGVLSFDSISSNNAGPMPYFIPTGESFIVNENFQGLFSQTITIDGELVVDGSLIEVGIAINSSPTQIFFDDNGVPTGNAGFTFDYVTGNLAVPGNIEVTGNILPAANTTYNLGSSTKRWNDIYLSNSTIYIGDSSITTAANSLVLTSGSGATFEVAGNANVSTLLNGNSNISIDTNSNITFAVAGVPNVVVVTTDGLTFTGNLEITGNIEPSGILTDNYYYANGSPINFQQAAGSNTQVQFNDNNDFGATANFTFNTTTNVLNVNGNITANNFTNANLLSANYITGTLTTASQPNITSVGTLTTLETSGNAIIGGNLFVNGNITYINVDTIQVEDPIIIIGGGPNGTPLTSNDGKDRGTLLQYYTSTPVSAFMGWDSSNSEFAFGSDVSEVNDLVTFNTLGNIRASTLLANVNGDTGTFSGNISAGNGNLGNIVTANYLVSSTGCVSVGGAVIVYDAGDAGIFNSLATNINFGLAANITAGSTTGTTTIRGNLIVNNNVYANTGTVQGSLLSGTLTTASQPNITSVGTLTSLTITGNISANNATANTVTTNSSISKRSNIAVTTDTVIDSFSKTDYRTAKYVVKSKSDIGYESLEVLLIHNNINSYVTVYAVINDGGGNTVSISTAINNANVELRATGLGANTVVNLIGTYVPD